MSAILSFSLHCGRRPVYQSKCAGGLSILKDNAKFISKTKLCSINSQLGL